MDCKKRRYYTNELKKEIIQKVKDGISRSDIQKEYGISKSSLSRWICPPDEIIGNANEETVRRIPIQPIPLGGRDDDDIETDGDNDANDDDIEVDDDDDEYDDDDDDNSDDDIIDNGDDDDVSFILVFNQHIK